MTLSYRDERAGAYRWECSATEWLAAVHLIHPAAIVALDRDLPVDVVMERDPHVRVFDPRQDYRNHDRTVHGYVYWSAGRHHWRCSAAFATYPDGSFAFEIQPEIDGDLL